MSNIRSVTLTEDGTSEWITPYPGARAIFVTSGEPDTAWPAGQSVKIQLGSAKDDTRACYVKDANGDDLEITSNTALESIPDVPHRIVGTSITRDVVFESGQIGNESALSQ